MSWIPFIVAGMALVVFRRPFAKVIVSQQNAFFDARLTTEDEHRLERLVLLAGLGMSMLATLAAIEACPLKP